MNHNFGKSGIGTEHSRLQKCFAAIIVLAFAICCFSGCGKSPQEQGDDLAFTKIADHLFEITYKDDFDWGKEEAPDLSDFACSGVQNGQYRGRNYDWIYGDNDLCVIRATRTDHRPHASIGVIDLSILDDGSKTYDADKIPFSTLDGINDAGVCVQVNVMPYNEDGALCHTDTTEDDLLGFSAVRYILDYADSVEDAVSIFKSKDVYTELGTIYELHWMISGPTSNTDKTTKTVVVEVFPDGIHVIDSFVDDKPIMTNFSLSNFDGSVESIGWGSGYERWQILSENFDQASSIMGTFDLMEKVYFSKMYDIFSDCFRYSEYNGIDLRAQYDDDELKDFLGEEEFDFYMENYGGVYYNPALFNGEKSLEGDIEKAGILKRAVQITSEWYKAQNMEAGNLSITVFTSVYDLENLTLDIQLRESQDHFHFTLR